MTDFEQMEEQESDEALRLVSWAEFLEDIPPGKVIRIAQFQKRSPNGWTANLPVIQLHCAHAACGGPRWFHTETYTGLIGETSQNVFLKYTCRNCSVTTKTFAIFVRARGEDDAGIGSKYGELPAFGTPIPARVQRLLQPDRELLLKGYRCEQQGLGIAAFTYYRRVVEHNKDRLLAEILRVANRLGTSPELTEQLERARSEIQFTKAVEVIRTGIPPALLINGQNPLTLLHRALSEGVHELSDDECLAFATSVRVVLTEFADRVAQALRDDAELKEALTRLQKR